MDVLEGCYNNPKYFADYYLRTLPCNLILKGSVPAEINHSSIINCLAQVLHTQSCFKL